MNFYVDSSCFVRHITADGIAVDWDTWESMYASTLVRVEVARTFNRFRVEGVYSDAELQASLRQFSELSAAIEWLPASEEVMAFAAQPTPFHIKSLDAIHLATARLLRDAATPDLAFATHDRALGLAAMAMGFSVVGV